MNRNKCRTCLCLADDLESLEEIVVIDQSLSLSYAQLLKDVTSINVLADADSAIMPKSICQSCSEKLKQSHGFIKQAWSANEQLQSLLKSSETLDCLQESEIDINSCLEIKLENNEDLVNDKKVTPGKDDKGCNLADNLNTIEDSNRDDSIFSPEMEDSLAKTESDISENTNANEELLTSDAIKEKSKPKSNTKNKKPSTKRLESKDIKDEDIAVPCLQCNKIFNNSKELTRHLRNTHLPEDQKCACPLCGIKFTRSCNMYKHMRKLHDPESVKSLLPTKEKPFECDKCHRRYTQQRQLNFHIKEKHSNDPDNTQDSNSSNCNDKKKKPDVRPLCFVCGSSFSNKAHLIVHMARHTGEKPFKCDLCDRAFPRTSDLTSHRRIHTGEKPFKCKLCEKAFRVSTKLATHMRSHTNERPFKCKQCERSFKYSKDLNIHKRVHTGERPYCCTVCGSTFTQSNSLKAHRMKLGHMGVQEEPTSQIMHFIS